MNDTLSRLPLPERIAACRVKAGDLLARAHGVSTPEVADELVTIALQWLMLAKQLENRQ
jgi:hypothetical protein